MFTVTGNEIRQTISWIRDPQRRKGGLSKQRMLAIAKLRELLFTYKLCVLVKVQIISRQPKTQVSLAFLNDYFSMEHPDENLEWVDAFEEGMKTPFLVNEDIADHKTIALWELLMHMKALPPIKRYAFTE